jgi:hypothetical protein
MCQSQNITTILLLPVLVSQNITTILLLPI